MITPGLYRHKKGNFYVVVGTLTDSTNARQGQTVVKYWSLSEGPSNEHGREIGEFTELVEWPDGMMRPRFCYVPQEAIK